MKKIAHTHWSTYQKERLTSSSPDESLLSPRSSWGHAGTDIRVKEGKKALRRASHVSLGVCLKLCKQNSEWEIAEASAKQSKKRQQQQGRPAPSVFDMTRMCGYSMDRSNVNGDTGLLMSLIQLSGASAAQDLPQLSLHLLNYSSAFGLFFFHFFPLPFFFLIPTTGHFIFTDAELWGVSCLWAVPGPKYVKTQRQQRRP